MDFETTVTLEENFTCFISHEYEKMITVIHVSSVHAHLVFRFVTAQPVAPKPRFASLP